MHESKQLAQDALLKRLARIEGQIRGIQLLIKGGKDCEKVAQQMSAARKAFDKAFFYMITCALEHEAFGDQNLSQKQQQSLAEIEKILLKYA